METDIQFKKSNFTKVRKQTIQNFLNSKKKKTTKTLDAYLENGRVVGAAVFMVKNGQLYCDRDLKTYKTHEDERFKEVKKVTFAIR